MWKPKAPFENIILFSFFFIFLESIVVFGVVYEQFVVRKFFLDAPLMRSYFPVIPDPDA